MYNLKLFSSGGVRSPSRSRCGKVNRNIVFLYWENKWSPTENTECQNSNINKKHYFFSPNEWNSGTHWQKMMRDKNKQTNKTKMVLENLMNDKPISVLGTAKYVEWSLFSSWEEHFTLKLFSSNTWQVALRKMVTWWLIKRSLGPAKYGYFCIPMKWNNLLFASKKVFSISLPNNLGRIVF